MNIKDDWLVLDTNIWIFGLRNQKDRPACLKILQHLNQMQVKIPRQVLLELQANLSDDEMSFLFQLLKIHSASVEILWDRPHDSLVKKNLQLGCKLGDAAVSAHLEELGVQVLVSENRDFLEEIEGLPFEILRSEEVLQYLRLS